MFSLAKRSGVDELQLLLLLLLYIYIFNHNFRDTINPMCPTNDGIEDTEHFLLLCPSFVMHRRDLLTNVLSLVRPFGYISLSNKDLTQLLLFGGKDLTNELKDYRANAALYPQHRSI